MQPLHETASYYDRLSAWTAVARWIGYGGGRASHTVHRALIDPRAHGRPTPTRLHDLLVETLPAIEHPRVLDAGCGMGGTMIDLASRLGGRYVGITLSQAQAALGRRAIAAAGLSDRVEIRVQSYDEPPDGPFDVIVAIESLAHAVDPAASLATLTRQLVPRGLVAIVDDMPAVSGDADLQTFTRGWRCPVLFSRDQYVSALAALGLELTTDRDLSPFVAPRSLARLAWLERVNRAGMVIPLAAWRMMLESYHGGLALERLYRRGGMQYRLLIARRQAGLTVVP